MASQQSSATATSATATSATATSATHTSTSSIPVVDLGPLLLTSKTLTSDLFRQWLDDPLVRDVADELVRAFTDVGFVYLINHGVSDQVVAQAYEVTDTFFQLPDAVKSEFARQWPGDNNGWIGLQKERLDSEKPADYKEAYNVLPLTAKVWPDDHVPRFRTNLLGMHDACAKLTRALLALLGVGLRLEEPDFFVKRHNMETNASYTTLRCLFYPPLPADTVLPSGAVRCGEHSDFGSITLLFQDGMGGLEVRRRDGRFVPAVPLGGAVVVNVADALERWTADRLLSTRHRVLLPEDRALSQKPRRSMAFFVHSDDDVVISCIDNSDKYPPIVSSHYTEMRINESAKLS